MNSLKNSFITDNNSPLSYSPHNAPCLALRNFKRALLSVPPQSWDDCDTLEIGWRGEKVYHGQGEKVANPPYTRVQSDG